jgi:hypothetical protein
MSIRQMLAFAVIALVGSASWRTADAEEAAPNQPQTYYVIPIKGVIGRHFTAAAAAETKPLGESGRMALGRKEQRDVAERQRSNHIACGDVAPRHWVLRPARSKTHGPQPRRGRKRLAE